MVFAFVLPDLTAYGIDGKTTGDKVWERISERGKGFHLVRAYPTGFDDGTFKIEIGDPKYPERDTVRRQDVYVFAAPYLEPSKQNMLNTLMIQGVRLAKAGHISLFETFNPWYAQDKPDAGHRESVNSKSIAEGYKANGLSHIFYPEPHNPGAMAHGFDTFDLVYMSAFHAANIAEEFELNRAVVGEREGEPVIDWVVGVPDAGSSTRSKYFARNLGLSVVPIPKIREHERPQEATSIGANLDLTRKTVFLYDDIIRSGRTMKSAARAAKEAGAKRVICVATHLGLYRHEFFDCEDIFAVRGTNTNPTHPTHEKLREYDISKIAAEIIMRESEGKDVTYYISSFAPSLKDRRPLP